MVHILWRNTKYLAHFDCSNWHCLVDRACGDTKWIPSCCLQLNSGRSLDQIIRGLLYSGGRPMVPVCASNAGSVPDIDTIGDSTDTDTALV